MRKERRAKKKKKKKKKNSSLHFDNRVNCFAKPLRCVFFFLSAAALSCLILDHLLWPLARTTFAAKERRHWAHIVAFVVVVDLIIIGGLLVRAARADNGDRERRDDISSFFFRLNGFGVLTKQVPNLRCLFYVLS